MSGDGAPDAVVAICTRGRPAELRTLIASIGRSSFGNGRRPDVEIVVVENGPERAGLCVDELGHLAGWPMRLVHEPRPGVAFARNRALRERGHAPLVIMVDDDQVVTRGWMHAHLSRAGVSEADVLTGPVLTLIPDEAPEWARIMWTNVPRRSSGSPMRSFLGGNVCFRAEIFDQLEQWFDERRPLATADDASFGRRLVELGHSIEWNDAAVAWERVHPARLTHRWTIERYLSFGGFEAEFAIDRHGRSGALRRGGADSARMLGRGLGALVRARNPERHAAAVALISESLGWFGGILGFRVSDYRNVTSAAMSGRTRRPIRHQP